MVLIQLLLPTTFPTGTTSQDAARLSCDTRRELTEKFDGLTAYVRSPARGTWNAPDGHVEQDDVVMVEVVTDAFDRAGGAAMRLDWPRVLTKRAFTSAPCP